MEGVQTSRRTPIDMSDNDPGRPGWKRSVVYQIYPRSFQDSDGDGIGDLAGILRRVDHVADLGVDVVWLSPVYRSPQDDNGYDISHYRDVDPMFGSLEDLDRVVEAFHEHDIKVVMDLVVNHTSDEHAWFVESRSSVDSPKRDWYWWRLPRDGSEAGAPGAEPNNWGSLFSGPAWHFDPETGEYYLHVFGPKQPDLNWENPEVREAIHEMMRWWLDRGIDGFRMDVINFISKAVMSDGRLPNGPVSPEGLVTAPFGNPLPHIVNGPRIHEFLQEMHDEVFEGRRDGLLLVGETPGATVDDAILYTDQQRRELDMVFTFEHVDLDRGPGGVFDHEPFDLRELKAVLGRWQTGLADVGWNALYLNNHDQPRSVSRFGDDGRYRRASATMLATVLHLHRGTPSVYQGEELGMTNAHFDSLDSYRDLASLGFFAQARDEGRGEGELLADLAVLSRDNARTPMQWDASHNAGFTTGTPWIEVNPNHRSINAEAERAAGDSVFHHYQRLIELRRDDPIVQRGDFAMLVPDHPHVYAFRRRLGDQELVVAGNFSGDEQRIEIEAKWEGAELVIGNHSNTQAPRGGMLALRPWEAVVFRVAIVSEP